MHQKDWKASSPQIVTDNVVANIAAKNIVATIRPTLFWSNCAAHTLKLLLEDIVKLPKYKIVIDKARHCLLVHASLDFRNDTKVDK